MNIRIDDKIEFINCIHDYIIEHYEIIPRDFETIVDCTEQSLIWMNGQITKFECNRTGLHIHSEIDLDYKKFEFDNEPIICCNEIDKVALQYLQSSIFSKYKSEIILSMHSWLPGATFNYVSLILNPLATTIESYLDPTYLFHFLISPTYQTSLTYRYYLNRNIVYSDYDYTNNDKTIMVRARSRSRSRSRSASPVRARGGRPRGSRVGRRRRYRSRSRSASPNMNNGVVYRSNNRRRTRSRSRSRSRSRY